MRIWGKRTLNGIKQTVTEWPQISGGIFLVHGLHYDGVSRNLKKLDKALHQCLFLVNAIRRPFKTSKQTKPTQNFTPRN